MRFAQGVEALSDALARYRAAGGVVDHLIVEFDQDEALDDRSRHREAALFAVWELETQLSQRVTRGLEYFRQPAQRWNTFTSPARRIEPEKLQGEPISVWDLLGVEHPLAHQRGVLESAYTYAFCCPPHGMRPSSDEIQAIFDDVSGLLFADGHSSFLVYSWTTDWADYFDRGHEWWGSHLWTVEMNAHPGRVIVLAASATD